MVGQEGLSLQSSPQDGTGGPLPHWPVRVSVSACARPCLREGCSGCVLLMLQKRIKTRQLIQSFMLALFLLLNLIDKNTQANDQFHGLFPLLSIQGIVSCHLVPPLQRERTQIFMTSFYNTNCVSNCFCSQQPCFPHLGGDGQCWGLGRVVCHK